MDGNHRTGFEISGKINRFDYGLKYNDLMELGGMVVGNDIRILVNVELFQNEIVNVSFSLLIMRFIFAHLYSIL